MTNYQTFTNEDVKEVFDNYPKKVRRRLLVLRSLILETAQNIPELLGIIETLKWGEPSYLPSKPRIGTTIRIDWKAREPEVYAMYFNCKTALLPTIKAIYGETLLYAGDRCVLLPLEGPLPEAALTDCITMAFTYHLLKKANGFIID